MVDCLQDPGWYQAFPFHTILFGMEKPGQQYLYNSLCFYQAAQRQSCIDLAKAVKYNAFFINLGIVGFSEISAGINCQQPFETCQVGTGCFHRHQFPVISEQGAAVCRFFDKMYIILAEKRRAGLIDDREAGYQVQKAFFQGQRLIGIGKHASPVIDQVQPVKRTHYIVVIPAFVQTNMIGIQKRKSQSVLHGNSKCRICAQ